MSKRENPREKIVAEMEERYLQAEKDAKYLHEFLKKLRVIEKNAAHLSDYYRNDWLKDYENFKSEKSYMILLQDPIFNSLQDIYNAKIKILKHIAKNMED